jgi:MinD superfamily P-loop ATPase
LNLPLGVVINRADIGDRQVWDDCHRQQIEILAEIPEDRNVARAYSQGRLAAADVPRLADMLNGLLEVLERSYFAADSAVA